MTAGSRVVPQNPPTSKPFLHNILQTVTAPIVRGTDVFLEFGGFSGTFDQATRCGVSIIQKQARVFCGSMNELAVASAPGMK